MYLTRLGMGAQHNTHQHTGKTLRKQTATAGQQSMQQHFNIKAFLSQLMKSNNCILK
jgi:hypothetical protein